MISKVLLIIVAVSCQVKANCPHSSTLPNLASLLRNVNPQTPGLSNLNHILNCYSSAAPTPSPKVSVPEQVAPSAAAADPFGPLGNLLDSFMPGLSSMFPAAAPSGVCGATQEQLPALTDLFKTISHIAAANGIDLPRLRELIASVAPCLLPLLPPISAGSPTPQHLPHIKALLETIAPIVAETGIELPRLKELLTTIAPDLLHLISAPSPTTLAPLSAATTNATSIASSERCTDLASVLRALIPILARTSVTELTNTVECVAPILAGLPPAILTIVLRTLAPILTSLPPSDLSALLDTLIPVFAGISPPSVSILIGALLPAIARLPASNITGLLGAVVPAITPVLPSLSNFVNTLIGSSGSGGPLVALLTGQ